MIELKALHCSLLKRITSVALQSFNSFIHTYEQEFYVCLTTSTRRTLFWALFASFCRAGLLHWVETLTAIGNKRYVFFPRTQRHIASLEIVLVASSSILFQISYHCCYSFCNTFIHQLSKQKLTVFFELKV